MHILLIAVSARRPGGRDTVKSPPGERAPSAPRRRAWIREDDARCPLIISISTSRLLSYLAWPLTVVGLPWARSHSSHALARPRRPRPPSHLGLRLRSPLLLESLNVYFPNSYLAIVMRINKMVIANPLV